MSDLCHQLEVYLDGQLGPAERAAFEAHLPGCAACAAAVASWERTGQALEGWAAPFAGAPNPQQLRHFRARVEAPPRRAWAPVAVALAGVAVAALVVVQLVRPRPASNEEWTVEVDGVVTASVALGAADVAQQVTIGPDRLDVASATRVDVLEKRSTRTRLRLTQGSVSAKVEPGHAGRQFIIDSPPFRVTVVGTTFEVGRHDQRLRVATTAGVVRVERLVNEQPVESTLVPAGAEIDWPERRGEAPAPSVSDAGAPAVAPPSPTEPARPVVWPASDAIAAWRRRAAHGECDQVYGETRAALERAPGNAAVWRVRADCARKLGLSAAAVEAYRKVIALAPKDESVEAMLLAAALLQDELADPAAVLEVTAAVPKAPASFVSTVHVRRAKALIALGRKAQALDELELVLTAYGSTPAAAEAVRLKNELRR